MICKTRMQAEDPTPSLFGLLVWIQLKVLMVIYGRIAMQNLELVLPFGSNLGGILKLQKEYICWQLMMEIVGGSCHSVGLVGWTIRSGS